MDQGEGRRSRERSVAVDLDRPGAAEGLVCGDPARCRAVLANERIGRHGGRDEVATPANRAAVSRHAGRRTDLRAAGIKCHGDAIRRGVGDRLVIRDQPVVAVLAAFGEADVEGERMPVGGRGGRRGNVDEDRPLRYRHPLEVLRVRRLKDVADPVAVAEPGYRARGLVVLCALPEILVQRNTDAVGRRRPGRWRGSRKRRRLRRGGRRQRLVDVDPAEGLARYGIGRSADLGRSVPIALAARD